MQAFSQDLRKRIVQAVKATNNQTRVAHTFQVSRSTVRRLVKLEKVDADLTPKKRPGRQTDIAPEDYPAVIALLEAKNDLTLQELSQLWFEQHHQKLSTTTFSRLLARLGWSRKKRVWQPPSATLPSAKSLNPSKPV